MQLNKVKNSEYIYKKQTKLQFLIWEKTITLTLMVENV